jgi:hypothetical protein
VCPHRAQAESSFSLLSVSKIWRSVEALGLAQFGNTEYEINFINPVPALITDDQRGISKSNGEPTTSMEERSRETVMYRVKADHLVDLWPEELSALLEVSS